MKTRRLIFGFLMLGSIFILPSISLAVDAPAQNSNKYTLLEPLPLGDGGAPQTEADLSTYLSDIFRLVIIFAGALAVFQLIRGGIMYVTSAAFNTKNDAKKIINETLIGLGLVLGSWIIVATIFSGNDDIIKDGNFIIDLSIPAIKPSENINLPTGEGGEGGRVREGYELTPTMLAQDTKIRTELENNNPPINFNSGPCTTGGTSGCTNAYGMPQRTQSGLKALATACGCSLEITGGTEGGHVTHGPGLPAVDLRPSTELNKYLAKTNPKAANPVNGTRVTVNGAYYTYETTGANGRASGNHWHVSY